MRACPKCRSVFSGEIEFCGIDGERLVRAEQDPLIGFLVDRYQIMERIGVGAMGCVYRAKHAVIDREFAVKVLFGEMASDKKISQRFRREAQAISRMRHPNIVNITDFGTSAEGLSFLVMELIQGQTLKDVLKTGQLKGQFDRIRNITRQIGEGLAEAHGRGLVHRDLKPGNVMIENVGSPREQIKILDFGIVGLTDGEGEEQALTHTGVALGTPAYMAPEQAQGDKVGPPADFYALGVMLYEMLAGGPPFKGTLSQVMVQHISAPPPPLPPCGGLEVIAQQLLEKLPANRIGKAADLLAAIDALGGGPPMPMGAPTPRTGSGASNPAFASNPAIASNPAFSASNPSFGAIPATTSLPGVSPGPALSPAGSVPSIPPAIPAGTITAGPPLRPSLAAAETFVAAPIEAPPPAPAFLRDNVDLTSSDRATMSRPVLKPEKNPLVPVLAISAVLGLLLAGGLAWKLRGAPAEVPSVTAAPDPTTEGKADPKPADPKPADPKPADPKPADPKSVQAVDLKPVQPAEPKAVDNKLSKEIPKVPDKQPPQKAADPKPVPATNPKAPDLDWEAKEGQDGKEKVEELSGSVQVNVVAAGKPLAAKVFVDGKLQAQAPAKLTLGIGQHVIRIETDDGTGAERQVFVRPGSIQSTIFEFSE